jgi:hypothetical protein
MTETPQAPATTRSGNRYLNIIIAIAIVGLIIGGSIWGMGIYAGREGTFYEGASLPVTMMDIGGNVFSVGVLFSCAALLYGALSRSRS